MAMVGNQDILGLQVSVINPDGMAVLHRVQDLQKGVLGQLIVANKSTVLGNIGEEVAFRTVFNHDKCAIRAFKDPQ